MSDNEKDSKVTRKNLDTTVSNDDLSTTVTEGNSDTTTGGEDINTNATRLAVGAIGGAAFGAAVAGGLLGPVGMVLGVTAGTLFSKFSKNKGIPNVDLMASQIAELGNCNSTDSLMDESVNALDISTIQNWVKRGIIESPDGKKYPPEKVARILMTQDLKTLFELKEAKEIIDFGESICNFTLVELYEYHLSLFSDIEKLSPSPNVLQKRALEIISEKRNPSDDDIKAAIFISFLTISKWAGFTKKLMLKWIETSLK